MAFPAAVTGLVNRWVASGVGGANGSAVASWPAAAGGVALAQATSASQPTLIAAGFGGQPTVRFDGVADSVAATLGAARSQPFTVMVVMKWNSVAAVQEVIHAAGFQLIILPEQWDTWAGVDVVGGASSTAPVVYSAVVNGAASRTLLNGTQVASGAVGDGQIGTTLTVGAYPGVGRYAAADISEIVVYSGAKSAAELASLHSYAQDTYGIAVADYLPTTAAGRVVDVWNGTALVRQTVSRWDGAALTTEQVST